MNLRYDNVTFLVCLPRSRSAWLAAFLKPIATTMHDPLLDHDSIEAFGKRIDGLLQKSDRPIFVADTMTTLFFMPIYNRFPNARFLFVPRESIDVRRSLVAAGMNPNIGDQRAGYEIAYHHCNNGLQGVMMDTVGYCMLNNHLRTIWRWVGGLEYISDAYIARMKDNNVQVPRDVQLARVDHNRLRRLFNSEGKVCHL